MRDAPEWVVAFDIGGTSTKLALVSQTGEIRSWKSFLTKPPRTVYLDQLTNVLRELAETSSVAPVSLAGAVAGLLSESGSLLYNPNLPWLEKINIRAELRESFDLPIQLETDANSACAGEFLFGAGQGSRRFLCVTGGTGVGVGMIVGEKFLRPAFNGLGDAGHIIVESNGRRCSCGGRGCAEALLSSSALAARFSELTCRPQTFRTLVRHVVASNHHAIDVAEWAGRNLGVLLASLTNVFFPDHIAIAGGLSALGERLLRSAQKSFASHAGIFPASLTTIELARTGAHASLQGAAASLWLATRDEQQASVVRSS